MSKQAFEKPEVFESELLSESDLSYGLAAGLVVGAGSLLLGLANQAQNAGIIELNGQKFPEFNIFDPAISTVAAGTGGFLLATVAAGACRKAVEKIRFNRRHARWIDYHVEMGARELEAKDAVEKIISKPQD